MAQPMSDPTREELVEWIDGCWSIFEHDTFDREEAIYWFAAHYHGGQWTNLYSALSTSEYRPGAMTTEPEPGSTAAMIYDELVARYFPETLGYADPASAVESL